MSRHLAVLSVLALAAAAPAAAQGRDEPAARALAERATARRTAVERDSALRNWSARARGFVFFLAQVGEGLADPPRLVKADELSVEVYWRAPGPHKQVIRAWRDGRWLPTGVHYHRDHLGIVTGDFGPVIRLGEGEEVRGVPHPLSPAGLPLYDFALADSLAIRGPDGLVAVRVLSVRPRDYARPAVIGELFLDAATAEVVRFRFGFTPAAYLDPDVEDIAVVLENGRWEGRWWLPFRQEIEIRRRSEWLDFPARGIIRGRWEIGGYAFNQPLPDSLFRGAAIGGLVAPDSAGAWERPLDEAIADVAAPATREDLAGVRRDLERLAGAQALSGLPATRPSLGSVSEVARVTRVQGLAVGAGWTFGSPDRRLALRPQAAYGFADGRLTGALRLGLGLGATALHAEARRRVRDAGDLRVISPILNSILAQEGGQDFGDWVLDEAVEAGVTRGLGGREAVAFAIAAGRTRSLAVRAEPSSGTYRANPPLGAGEALTATIGLERRAAGGLARRDLAGRLSLEASTGDLEWLRAALDLEARWPAGPGALLLRAHAIAGSDELPAWRGVAFGGRGTLIGEAYRAFGGRQGGVAHLEWRLALPAPEIRLGGMVGTGGVTVAPFAAAGWADGALPGVPWAPTDALRPVAGLALEWPMGLLRVEGGVALRTGKAGVTVDVHRTWWGIL
ncbi:MAG TPA: hypothetical protein VLA95_03335 [Gemmatimonadales bacterium]|nr:hypothetical protein [Gemmatimonadales bacterium]